MKNLRLDRPLAFIDVETTGLKPYSDRIVELSILKIHPDGREDYKNHRVNPEVPIPAEATAIHGITDADVAEEPFFRQYAKSIRDFLENCDIAGFNVIKFDLPCLEAEFAKETTLEEIATFRKVVEEANTQVDLEMQKLNNVYRATSNQEIRDHMKGTIGQYITSLTKSFTSTLEVLSSGNPEQMREAAGSLNEQLAASEEVNKKTSELMARYGH